VQFQFQLQFQFQFQLWIMLHLEEPPLSPPLTRWRIGSYRPASDDSSSSSSDSSEPSPFKVHRIRTTESLCRSECFGNSFTCSVEEPKDFEWSAEESLYPNTMEIEATPETEDKVKSYFCGREDHSAWKSQRTSC
jgi:hypothetical protein